MKNARRLDKAITRTLQSLMGHTPLDTAEALFAVAEIAGTERKLRKAAKAVVEASKGTDEAAMDEAIDQLRKALK
jgi:hypothetical protein